MAPQRDKEEYKIAMKIIDASHAMAMEIAQQKDRFDSEWMLDGAVLNHFFSHEEGDRAHAICKLAAACETQVAAQATLAKVSVPTKVFGDIHGQFRDLLMLFAQFGFPNHTHGDVQQTSYVFNGDWVDRGEHQLEVVCLLFALKVVYPSQIYLVRGNHEFRSMSECMEEEGFKYHCEKRLPTTHARVFERIHQTFDWCPIAALVGGKVLVIHGGIGDGEWGLKDLEQVERPLEEENSSEVTLNALWSDPSDSDRVMMKGVHQNFERGDEFTQIKRFGPDITEMFCAREGISMIVRSHQYVRQGYKVMHHGHLITLFSSRNYMDDDDNDGAMLLFAPDLNEHLRVHPKRLVKCMKKEPERGFFKLLWKKIGLGPKIIPWCGPVKLCLQGIIHCIGDEDDHLHVR